MKNFISVFSIFLIFSLGAQAYAKPDLAIMRLNPWDADARVRAMVAELQQTQPEFFHYGGKHGLMHLIQDPKGEVQPFILSDTVGKDSISNSCPAGSRLPNSKELTTLKRAMTLTDGNFAPYQIPGMWGSRIVGQYFQDSAPVLSGHIYDGAEPLYWKHWTDVRSNDSYRCILTISWPPKKPYAKATIETGPIAPVVARHTDPKIRQLYSFLRDQQGEFFQYGGRDGHIFLVQDPHATVPPFVLSGVVVDSAQYPSGFCPAGSHVPTYEQFSALTRAMSLDGAYNNRIVRNMVGQKVWVKSSSFLDLFRGFPHFSYEDGDFGYLLNTASVQCALPLTLNP